MTKTILIIDDEPDIRDYIMAVLEDHGYIPHTIIESESILEAAKKYKPDLIILDIMMPQRAGISIYKSLRISYDFADIPIALLSGIPFDSEFIQSGFLQILEKESIPPPNRFIEKPIHLPSLLTSIKSILEERSINPDDSPRKD